MTLPANDASDSLFEHANREPVLINAKAGTILYRRYLIQGV